MLKSAIITFFGGLLIMASLAISNNVAEAEGASHNQSTNGTCRNETVSEASQRIWQGLWQGANLDFSLKPTCQSAASNQKSTTTPAASQPTPTPAPTSAPPTAGRYVAMGDSVAAGFGLPLPAGATSRDRTCGRSDQAYPHHVANALQLQLTHIACSGATAGDLSTPQGIRNASNPSRQIATVFAANTSQPTLVTVTAGANDLRWSNLVYKCARLTCGTQGDSTYVNAALVALQLKLTAFLTEMQFRSNGTPPTTVFTGYYNPLSDSCVSQLGTNRNGEPNLTSAELAWVSSTVEALNQTISNTVAQYPFARYVAVDFSGHDICSADPWIQGLSDPKPIHPNSAGQQAIANAILGAI